MLNRSVEVRQLIYFNAVVEHGGFTRAAKRLHIAQPAISAQVRRLEAELGTTLLQRTTRQVKLTHAGELVLGHSRRVLQEIDALRADVEQLTDVLRGRVRIGAVEALGPFDLHGALALLHAQYPGVELGLKSASVGRELLEALDTGDLDLALGPTPDDLPDRYASREVFSEELVIITGPAHRLARRAALNMGELSGDPFVSFPPASGLRRILDDLAAGAGFTAHVPFETTSLSRIRGLVSHGLGTSVVARSVAEGGGPPVTIHALEPDPVYRAIGLIHPAGSALSPAAAVCRDLLIDWSQRPATRQ